MSKLNQRSFYCRLGFVASVLFGLFYNSIFTLCLDISGQDLFDTYFGLAFWSSLILPLIVFCIINKYYINFVCSHFEGKSYSSIKIKVINIILYVAAAVGSFFIYFLY